MQITLPYQWQPRKYQLPLWNYLHNGGKRAVIRYHRRAGKDDVFLNYTACAAHERTGNYWYMLPEYAQARKSMWDAINPHTGVKRLDQVFPEQIRSKTNQQEMKIELKCGSTVQLVGSDNFNSLVGSPPVGLVFSEYAISNPAAWAYLMPILEENNGWAGFNSTPRGKNHFYKTCLMAEDRHDWFYDVKTVDETNIFTIEQLQRIRLELHAQYGEDFGEAIYQQEYYVSFDAAVIGAIWADCIAKLQFQNRITSIPHNPALPVHCAYDLGSSDATAIWFFQITSTDIYLINYHESNHHSIEFYNQLLRDLSEKEGYQYASQWLPHDAWASHLAAGGKTIQQQFIAFNEDGKLGKIKKTPNVSINQGIQAARATFPRCWFDETKCADGLEALRYYHHDYDNDKKVYKDNPAHDWSSHCADAFRYMSLVWREARNEQPVLPVHKQLIDKSIQSITMKQITMQHLKRAKAAREN